MNIKDAIKECRKDFYILGSSQNIFTDWSWYKEFDYDYFTEYLRQYDEKKHMFLIAGHAREYCRDIRENDKLENAVINANKIAWSLEEGKCTDVNEILFAIERVTECTDNGTVKEFNAELKKVILKLESGEEIDFSQYPTFWNSFGKTSQYISLVKK